MRSGKLFVFALQFRLNVCPARLDPDRLIVSNTDTRIRGVRFGIGSPGSAYHSLRSFDSIGELGAGICCHSGDDMIVRAIDQMMQIAGRDGPEYA